MFKSRILVWLSALTLAACGGGDKAFTTPATTGGTVASAVASVVVQASVGSIPADNSLPSVITAYVRDANNQLMANVPVTFSSSSGALAVIGTTTGMTDASGTIKANLTTPGDASLRAITVRATAGAIQGTTTVNVTNTAISILLLSDSASIPSDNTLPAVISAYVRDSNNSFLPGIVVSLTSDTGALTPVVTQTGVAALTTDSNGLVKANLSTLGNKTNRVITVTARVGATTATATVAVTGTTLAVLGPTTFNAGQTGTYTVTLNDSGAHGIPNTAITITPPANGTVSSTALTTNAQGTATFVLTAGASGSGVITAAGLGLTTTANFSIASDSLVFTVPTAAAPPPHLRTLQPVTVVWKINGVPVVGQSVNFATTRGCVNPAGTTCILAVGPPQVLAPSTGSAVTNATGAATVQVLSDDAGGATVTATTAGSSASLPLQFVATVPASIDVQPGVFTVAANGSTKITAIVRDAQNNLVAGATVAFSLQDITGGTLSAPSAVTDTLGRAQTTYNASSAASATNGVVITASIPTTAISKSVSLTVARQQVFISIGTGNTIAEPNAAQYQVDYIVQVTDANGVGVANAQLSMSLLSVHYKKGYRVVGSSSWTTTITATCNDEDTNHNGVLDPGEDFNNSTRIEAGNVASVSQSTITTDANGFALVSIFYPQEFAYYLDVTLQAQAQVQGTAFAASSTFTLQGSATDFNSITTAPPGPVSRYGQGNSCTDTL
jgi:hypothetical protein